MIQTDGCIYHYTDSNGINGILENSCLWATHHNFTNDLTELRVFPKIFQDWLSLNKPYNVGDIKYDLLEAFRTQIEGPLSPSVPFISSFCNDDGNTLSQWRGYGNRGGGYAIGFNCNKINEYKIFISNHYSIDFVHFTPIYYDYNKSKDQIEKDISYFIKLFENYCDSKYKKFNGRRFPLSEYQMEMLTKASNIYYKWTVSCKNISFNEEKEYRFVTFIPNRNQFIVKSKQKMNIKYRDSGGNKVPYVEIFKEIMPMTINRVVIGPSPDRGYRRDIMILYLKKKGLDFIKVDISEIPLRG